MARFLVVVESPGKIKKLKQILGADYHIIASMGHVMDLPPKAFGVDVTTMQASYVVMKADIAKRLRAEAKKPYERIFLASDPDREGEAISQHVATLIRKANSKATFQRVSFDAITPGAVRAAFKQPRGIDEHLVAAQEARRILDRLVGFPSSRLLWQFVEGRGLSAGRVQSVALRLVIERDDAIARFVPEEYWTITALFTAQAGDFLARLTHWQGKKAVIKSQAEAEAILAALNGVDYRITSVTPKQRRQKAPAPFTTSTLQQAASSHLRIAPDTTMKLAQKLYESGYITYMRTDSPAVSPEGARMAADTIRRQYGEAYLGSNRYSAKGSAQEAHECVRPTDTEVTPDSVRMAMGEAGSLAARLYQLIYQRFLASQMAEAVYNEVLVTVAGGAAVFSAKGSTLAFDGFLRVYNLDEEKETVRREDEDSNEDDSAANKQLPPLTVGEGVRAKKLNPQQHFTKPPVRYSEALLIKAMEQHGVGRPSTYAQTVATLKKRGYVEVERRKLTATALGRSVHSVLQQKLPGLFEVGFTAQMESALDDVALGKRDGRGYLKDFWTQVSPLFGPEILHATLDQSEKGGTSRGKSGSTPRKRSTKTTSGKAPRSRSAAARTDDPTTEAQSAAHGLCPRCGKPLVQRTSKYGPFLGCSGFPKCRFTKDGG
jgi:DNA topoisomerase I